MTIEHSQLRNIVLDYLRHHPDGQVNLIGDNFAKTGAEQLGLAFGKEDNLHVLEIFHELYREGIIVSGSDRGTSTMGWPFYRVTEYGRQVLETADYVPYDPDGYLAQIQRDVPSIDPAIIRYLQEALGCFRAGHMLAAAVMTGCAAEKAMLLLIEVFGGALTDPTEQSKYNAVIEKHWMIGRKYKELWKRLRQKLDQLPSNLSDDLEVILDRVFDLIRATRNAAGHPIGKTVDRNTVRANFILFPTYCRRIFELIDWLQSESV